MNEFSTEHMIDSRLAAQRAVLLKAQHDPLFRQLLKADPTRALREAFGIVWDPSVVLTVVEESDSTCVLVLPPVVVAANDDELTDDDLERVAAGASGGQTPTCYVDRYGVEHPNSKGA